MQAILKRTALVCIAASASGCMSDDYRRADGLTDGAGDSIAANTVMQMVDPWQNGVQETRLLVPAARPATTGAADSAASVKGAQSTTN